MKKIYYRITFRLTSSMSVGSGKNDATDRDLLRNSQGKPYIPGTTLAGIYRSLFSKEMAELYFGDEISDYGKNLKESCVLVYDANIQSEKFKIVGRDCVALDEYKTGISKAKFDFEILEPGVFFVTYIEQNVSEKLIDAAIEKECQEEKQLRDIIVGRQILCHWLCGDVVIGSKATRGLGRTVVESADYAVFDLKDEGLENWLDFDMYEDAGWKSIDLMKLKHQKILSQEKISIHLVLKQKSGISIRRYTTTINEKGNEQPDYEQMTYVREEGEKEAIYPVIPGTSWAGAFRHQMEKINQDCIQDNFGFCRKGESKKSENGKSKISFSESEITGASSKQITRNAVDRFTNATVNGALYTERTYYGGNTVLDITMDRDVSDMFKDALAAAVIDLHMGFMAIGGLTSVGRGLFEIKTIEVDGRQIDADLSDGMKLYNQLREAIQGGEKEDEVE